jgi:ABC-type uncharacterized transport system substrate-binding protein
MTGVTLLSVEVGPKLLELLHDVVPRATIMALLVNPTNPNIETQSRNLQAAALKLGLQVHVLNASTERDFDAVFAKLHELRADALMIGQDVLFNTQSGQLASLSVRHAMPAIYVAREFAAAGGLMSYGTNESEAYRQAGIYAGRILKGEKPAELPVGECEKTFNRKFKMLHIFDTIIDETAVRGSRWQGDSERRVGRVTFLPAMPSALSSRAEYRLPPFDLYTFARTVRH